MALEAALPPTGAVGDDSSVRCRPYSGADSVSGVLDAVLLQRNQGALKGNVFRWIEEQL